MPPLIVCTPLRSDLSCLLALRAEFGAAIEGLHWATPALSTIPGPHRRRQRLIIGTGGRFEIDQFVQWPALSQPPEDQLIATELLHALLVCIATVHRYRNKPMRLNVVCHTGGHQTR
jgi:hypothetical protein